MKKLLLNGAWKMRSTEESGWHDAVVPGSVYEDLLRDGTIGDPFWRENETASLDVARKDYIYTRDFEVDAVLLACDRVMLTCEGVDTVAEVYVNGIHVMSCKNMHMTHEADVREQLRAGVNTVEFRFMSPFRYAEILQEENPDMDLKMHMFQAKMMMRKAHHSFGWDWGPALPDIGLWKPVSLIGYEGGRITDFYIGQKQDIEYCDLECRAECENYKDGLRTVFSVYGTDGVTLIDSRDAENGKATLRIDSPEKWWCNKYGAHPLYTVTAAVYDGDTVVYEEKKRIGIRTLVLNRENDSWGQRFSFRINDVQVFAMGADYIPEDSLLGRYTPERQKKLIETCVEANFNMIRVWGGGVYPTDDFLDYCDENGIMLWQDFMFANSIYLWYGEYKENMIKEMTQFIRRVRSHPCLALLCGNNETELFMWGHMEERFKQLYFNQFERDMKKLVEREAPGVSYWPSSPSGGGQLKDISSDNIGDQHDWNVWHGRKPFTHYRETFPRFNSEFGLQSFPDIKTIETFTLPEDRNIFSPVMDLHQKCWKGNETLFSYIAQYFRFPKDFESVVYLSQAIQLEGIRHGVEHWRRNRNGERCMGALFWQLNDCWQVASWSSVDYFGRWKALQYGARRFFAPVLVSHCEDGTRVELHVSNETLYRFTGRLSWKLVDTRGNAVTEGSRQVETDRLHSDKIVDLDLSSELDTEEKKRSLVLWYSLEGPEGEVGYGVCCFKPAKHMNIERPQITCRRTDDRTFELETDRVARFVELSFKGDYILSDNWFDMIPGVRRTVTCKEPISEEPRITSLYDTYN